MNRREFTKQTQVAMRGECSIAGCGKPHFGHSFCVAHYTRWRRHGDPHGGGTPRGVRFEALDEALNYTGDNCLIWQYTRNSAGYAQIQFSGKGYLVSRVVCERVHGPCPPDKEFALHSCGMGHEGCISPRHLRWGTRQENAKDAIADGAMARGERNGKAILTDEQVREIKKLIRKVTHKDLAARYGVSRQTITNISTGTRWSWMEGAL